MVATVLIIALLVVLSVSVHYEMLYRFSNLMPERATSHRYRVLVGVVAALCAHVIEIWLFAIAYYWMIKAGGFGTLQRNFNGSLLDCAYFSASTYSTLGVGDIEPTGALRFVAGMESLVGLVLIAWTASFMFSQMQRFWDAK